MFDPGNEKEGEKRNSKKNKGSGKVSGLEYQERGNQSQKTDDEGIGNGTSQYVSQNQIRVVVTDSRNSNYYFGEIGTE